MKVYIDNNLVQHPTETLTHPSFTLRKKDEDGGSAFSFTGELVFIEADYTYIYQKLVLDVNAQLNKIELKFVEDCCPTKKEYLFEIDHESLEWCEGKCSISASAIEKSIDNAAYICLKNTFIWDNYNGFQQKQHPRMTYCNEIRPNWQQHNIMLLVLGNGYLIITLAPILAVVVALIAVYNVVINFINNTFNTTYNTLNFDNDPSTNVFQELKNLFDQLVAKAVGCGRKHPSPLVREYAKNVCGKCGIQFSSSILDDPNSPYYNTVWVQAPAHKGVEVQDTTTHWIDENKPIENGITFFDKLKKIHNADYKIVGGVLYYERKDIINAPKPPFLDLTTYPSDKINSVCWKWQDKNMPSYAWFKYQKDVVNWLGHESDPRWRAIVEWNQPYNPLQKGEYSPVFEFSAARFRDDGIETDILTLYEGAPYIGNLIKGWKRAILMNSHNCVLPMLIVWDPASGVKNSTASGSAVFFNAVLNGGEKQTFVGVNEFYNYPYWFNQQYPGNLYTNFHYIDNPKLSTFKGFQFTAEIQYDCDLKTNLDIYGSVMTSKGLSKELKVIAFDEKTGLMTIEGTV